MTKTTKDDEDKYQTTQPIVDGRKTSGFVQVEADLFLGNEEEWGLGDEKVMRLISRFSSFYSRFLILIDIITRTVISFQQRRRYRKIILSINRIIQFLKLLRCSN